MPAPHVRDEIQDGVATRVVPLPDGPVTIGRAADADVVRFPDKRTASLVTLVYRNPLAPRIAPVHHGATPPGGKVLRR